MFKKLIIGLLLLSFLVGCSAPTSPIQPQINVETTVVPAGSNFTTAEGKIVSTPVAIPIPTPPILQDEFDGLSIYYIGSPLDFDSMWLAMVPVGTFAGTTALADGPIPVGDIVGLVVFGTAVVGYIVNQAVIPANTVYYESPTDLQAILGLWGTTVSAYIPVTEEHKATHTVVIGSSNVATQVFADLSKRWPPDPNEQDLTRKVLCYVLKNGSQVLRYLVWAGVELSATGLPRGNISWWQNGPSGPEAYGYTGKSLRTMENVPSDLQGKGYSIEPTSCDNFTPPFQLLGQ